MSFSIRMKRVGLVAGALAVWRPLAVGLKWTIKSVCGASESQLRMFASDLQDSLRPSAPKRLGIAGLFVSKALLYFQITPHRPCGKTTRFSTTPTTRLDCTFFSSGAPSARWSSAARFRLRLGASNDGLSRIFGKGPKG